MQTINIEIYSENKDFSCIINRRGEITLLHEKIDFLLKYLINQEVELFIEKNRFYSERDRISTNNKPKLIKVIFDKKIFDDKVIIFQLLNKIEKYPLCNYNIIEKGNPFLYVNILDRRDMSSFSIRTYMEDSLLLIPKIKTSSFALQRFSKYLVENFMEGRIVEYNE